MDGATSQSLVCDALIDRRGFRELFAGLNFTVAAGQLLEITGANGSGKSTLLHCLTGLRRPESGQVLWCGNSVSSNVEFLSGLRFVGHKSAIKAAFTPRENLQTALELAGIQSADIEAVLGNLGLASCIDLPCRQLSAGQKRRVALARLAVSPGHIWILDEPFSALDEQGREWVAAAIRSFCDAGGMVVLTTHQLVDVPGLTPQRLRLAA